MARTDHRRRRRRRLRPSGKLVALVLAAVVVLVVVVGGALRAGSQSRGYWRAVDLSFALQARPIARASNTLCTELRTVVATMPSDTRTKLQAALDTLVHTADRLAAEATTASSPAPDATAGGELVTAMSKRAEAVHDVRRAVDGLLGMAPLRSANSTSPPPRASAHLSASGASAVFEAAVTALDQGDRSYAAARRTLEADPGHASLPESVWNRRTVALTTGRTQELATSLASSPTLAVVHRVVLAKNGVSLTPAPVPPAGGTGAGAVVPPTGSLEVAALVANRGNVPERGVVISAALSSGGKQSVTRRSRPISLAPRASIAVRLPALHVLPAQNYSVTVTVDPPVADAPGATTTESFSVSVAPPAPPTVLQLVPAKGRARGKTGVTILGTGFTWVRRVRFGGVPARFTVVSNRQITAVAPPGTGTVHVVVVNRGGASSKTSASSFTYRSR